MKVKKMENVWNKCGLTGCKWSSLNAPGTETPLSHSVLELEQLPFPHYWPSGVIRIGSQYEGEKYGKFSEQNMLKRLQMV